MRSVLAALLARLVLLAALYGTARSLTGDRLPYLPPRDAETLRQGCRDLACAQRLLRSAPDDPGALAAQAEAYGALQDFRQEARAWERVMDVGPNPTAACPRLGQAYMRAGLPERALDAHRRCLALDPRNSDLMLFTALALEQTCRDAEAEALYRSILKAHPLYEDASLGLARLHSSRGRFAQAEAIIGKVLEAHPEHIDAIAASAVLAHRIGRDARAKALIARGLELSPGYADLYKIRSEISRREGDLRGARVARAEWIKLAGRARSQSCRP